MGRDVTSLHVGDPGSQGEELEPHLWQMKCNGGERGRDNTAHAQDWFQAPP